MILTTYVIFLFQIFFGIISSALFFLSSCLSQDKRFLTLARPELGPWSKTLKLLKERLFGTLYAKTVILKTIMDFILKLRMIYV